MSDPDQGVFDFGWAALDGAARRARSRRSRPPRSANAVSLEPVQASRSQCLMIPFPLARRISFIRKHAARMAALPRATAERHLIAQLKIQAETLRRKDVPEVVVEREIKALSVATCRRMLEITSSGQQIPRDLA